MREQSGSRVWLGERLAVGERSPELRMEVMAKESVSR